MVDSGLNETAIAWGDCLTWDGAEGHGWRADPCCISAITGVSRRPFFVHRALKTPKCSWFFFALGFVTFYLRAAAPAADPGKECEEAGEGQRLRTK